jgi:UDP-N-acetylglucosamine/UDP-N-acetylgalactosamine diphosphorylase
MMHPPSDLRFAFDTAGQGHVFAGWDLLDGSERESLVEQLRGLDLELLARLYADRDARYAAPDAARIEPLPDVLPDAPDPEAAAIGAAALEAGEVAVIVVAGGLGSRLGFEHPKGLFPIGPISRKSLFQIHAEKVLARSQRAGRPVPLLVMTSHATHAETVYFFEKHGNFGLPTGEVFFFQQGTMPALDLASGRLLLEHPGRLFAGPDGHGGALTALAGSGLLDRLADRGVRHLFYFQVDNPLVKIADPTFLGQHIRARADVSSKVIPKDGPHDKLGNFVLIDRKLAMIEYSDLPDELARATEPDGRLRIRAGNPAIHIFDVAFLRRVTEGAAAGLPFHLARKKVPYWDPATGNVVSPDRENALKFERFIFDVLPLAERYIAVETARPDEFAPLKNAQGPDSPATVQQAMSALAARWLRSAGVAVPDGAVIELSPLTALEPADLLRHGLPTSVGDGTVL